MKQNFRAWYVLAEEMIDEILMISFLRKEIIGKFSNGYISVPLKFEDKRNGEDVILMQSTGLFDRNGNEVFVGDIIKCTRGCPHEVYIEKGICWYIYWGNAGSISKRIECWICVDWF